MVPVKDIYRLELRRIIPPPPPPFWGGLADGMITSNITADMASMREDFKAGPIIYTSWFTFEVTSELVTIFLSNIYYKFQIFPGQNKLDKFIIVLIFLSHLES